MTLEQPNPPKGDVSKGVTGEPQPLIHALHPKGREAEAGVQLASNTSNRYSDDLANFLSGGKDKPKKPVPVRGIDQGEAPKINDDTAARAFEAKNPNSEFGMVPPALFTAALMAGKLEPPAKLDGNPDQKYLASQFQQTKENLLSSGILSAADVAKLGTAGEVSNSILAAKSAEGADAHTAINKFLHDHGMDEVATPVGNDGIIVSAVAKIKQAWNGRGGATDPIQLDGKSYDAFALDGVTKYTAKDGSSVYKLSDSKGTAIYVAAHPGAFANGAEFEKFIASHTPGAQQQGDQLSLRMANVDKSSIVDLKSLEGMPVGKNGETISYAVLQNKLAMNKNGLSMESAFTAGVSRSIELPPPPKHFDETFDPKQAVIWQVTNGQVIQNMTYKPEDWKGR